MLETEVAETLMSLSAPDERAYKSPLYAWHTNDKKRSFQSSFQPLGSSLPAGGSYLDDYASLQRQLIRERPLTAMIPAKHRRRDALDDDDDDNSDDDERDSSDVDMASDASSDEPSGRWRAFRSPFDGLVAAAASNQDDHDELRTSSRPISIPSKRESHDPFGLPPTARHGSSGKSHKWSLSRVKEDASYIGQDSSPTGVEDDRAWFDEYRQSDEYRQRARLASVCSSDGSISEYGGFGRKHLEEFIRMEISAANENESSNQLSDVGSPTRDGDTKYIGSYSPEARRKRIERFLEKRKHRVWSKKVDYDVRKNFANSRLRVKGRFVKKEDEELLCQLMSFT